MIESGESLVEVHNPTDNTVDSLTLKFLFVRVEMILQGVQINIEHNGAVMKGLSANTVFTA